jgi:hypothetical protein
MDIKVGGVYRNRKTGERYKVFFIAHAAWDRKQELVVYRLYGLKGMLHYPWVRSCNEFLEKFEEEKFEEEKFEEESESGQREARDIVFETEANIILKAGGTISIENKNGSIYIDEAGNIRLNGQKERITE